MSKRQKTPAQLAVEAEAWRQYYLAFERQGLPVPQMQVSPNRPRSFYPRMQVFANGQYQTVFADGSKSALASLKERWAELMREMAEIKAATLHADVWERWNKERWK